MRPVDLQEQDLIPVRIKIAWPITRGWLCIPDPCHGKLQPAEAQKVNQYTTSDFKTELKLIVLVPRVSCHKLYQVCKGR